MDYSRLKVKNIIVRVLFLLLFLQVFVNAESKGITPSIVKIGDRYKVYWELNGYLKSEYDIRVKDGFSTIKLSSSNRKYWYGYFRASKVGRKFYTFTVFKNGRYWNSYGMAQVTVKGTSVSIPSKPNLTVQSSNSIYVSWSSVSGATQYRLYRATSYYGSYRQIYYGSSRYYYDSGSHLSSNKTYYYKLKAVSSSGESSYSNISSATTKASDIKKSSITSPRNGSTFNSTTMTFRWNDTGSTQYYLKVGTKKGANNLYSRSQGRSTARTIKNLPSNGSRVYVRLYTRINGKWQYNDYVYTAYSNNDNMDKSTLIGIDVSSHNGNINWEAVKSDNISFAFIKATEGYPETSSEKSNEIGKNFLDANFNRNIKNAINQGLLVAPYHFIRVDYNEKISDAKEAARYFLSKIEPYYNKYELLPPVIDIENPPKKKEYSQNKNQIQRWSKKEFSDWIRAFANEVENRLGVKPILYMNESFTDNEVESSLLNSYKLWIAKYKFSSKNGTVINTIEDLEAYNSNFKPNKSYLFWQYTETSNDIDGIVSTFVDKNIFKGTINNLKNLLVKSKNTNNKVRLSSVYPSTVNADTEDITLTIYGKNLENISKLYIEGIKYYSYEAYGDRIVVSVEKVHGGSDRANFGYRKIIAIFSDNSRVTSNKLLYVKEKSDSYFLDLPYKGTYKITQGNNGSTSHYNHDKWDNTYAIDFAMPLNTKILAPASGEVVCLYDENHKGGEICGYKPNDGCIGGGRVMVVKDKKGNYLTFLHLQSFNKEIGDSVDKGDILAYSGGSKGVSGTCYNKGYGYHLHFHLWSGDKTPDSHTTPFTIKTKLRVKLDGQTKFLYDNYLNDNKIKNKLFGSFQ
jgi:GH25 family lysozyme M1 (1,4-beta-N-acetylmuramidase)